MRLWRWLTDDRWAIWLYTDDVPNCVMSTHRTWWLAHHAVHELERISRWRYPPVYYRIERIGGPIGAGQYCIDR